MDDAHRLDAMRAVLGEHGFDLLGIDRRSPIAGKKQHIEAQPLGHRLPQRGEVAGFHHEHPIARRERVHKRCLPRPRARRRKDDHRFARFEDPLEPFEHPLGESLEFGPTVIDGRAIDGPQDAVGNVRGPRDLEKVPSGSTGLGHRDSSAQTKRWRGFRLLFAGVKACVRAPWLPERRASCQALFGFRGNARKMRA